MTEPETPLEGTVSQVKPWAIKAIEVSPIQAISNAAHAERITVGEWLTKRVREWTAHGQAVAVVPKPPASLPAPGPADDLADLDRILNMAGRLKELGGPDAATLANMASPSDESPSRCHAGCNTAREGGKADARLEPGDTGRWLTTRSRLTSP
jgi:hypothetical protein